MKRTAKLIIIPFLFLNLSGSGFAEETIRLTTGEWSPFISKNLKNGGVVLHIITESAKMLNLKFQSPSRTPNFKRFIIGYFNRRSAVSIPAHLPCQLSGSFFYHLVDKTGCNGYFAALASSGRFLERRSFRVVRFTRRILCVTFSLLRAKKLIERIFSFPPSCILNFVTSFQTTSPTTIGILNSPNPPPRGGRS